MRGWALLLMTTAGCGPPDPLVDTPIVGGTPEVRAAVRDELAAFDRATGGGRTRVSRVRIREVDGYAHFERLSNTIVLSDEIGPEAARFALRHELCHALDDVDGPLWEERGGAYTGLSDQLFTGAPWDTAPDGARNRETFASLCALGPSAAQLLSRACPGEPPDVAPVMAHLWDRVWTAAPWLPVADEAPPWASIDGGAAPSRPQALAAGHGAVHLAWEDGPVARDGWFDLRDGAPVGQPPVAEAAHLVPEGLPEGLGLSAAGSGWRDGPAVATLTVSLYHLAPAERLLVSDGESWAVVGDGCADGAPFAADGRVFTVRVDGGTISWGPVP